MICWIAAFPVLYTAIFSMICGGIAWEILRRLVRRYVSVTEEPHEPTPKQ